MKKIMSLVAIAAIMFACGGPQKKTEVSEMDVHALMVNVDQYVGKTVTAMGVVDHVCGHGGGKMFMVCAESEHRLKVEPAGDLQSFSPEMEGSKYAATGLLEELRINEEYLANWEKEIAAKDEAKEEGHDHSAHGEKADMGEHVSAVEKIKTYREKIAATEKGYLSFYTLKATKVEKIESDETEADETEESEEGQE
jgi:hypothetical protein